jgi:hypothetical protein
MPLGNYMLGSAVVLVGDLEDEKTKASWRGPIGTGFFVRVESEREDGRFYGYLMTCNHVVEDQNHVEMKIPMFGEPTDYYPTLSAPEFEQPEGYERLDLTLAEFGAPEGYTITTLQLGFNVLPLVPAAMLSMDFHYVGYLAPLDLVMARSGTLGRIDEMLPDAEYEYRTHIGDVRSYGGFSGSPCFIEIPLPVLVEKENPFPQRAEGDEPVGRLGYVHLLCGMFTGHLEPNRRGLGGDLASRHGVGFILSSDEIIEVLMSDKLRQERREKDEAGAPKDVRSRTSISGASDEEFENFEDLTRRLVNTPKPKRESH